LLARTLGVGRRGRDRPLAPGGVSQRGTRAMSGETANVAVKLLEYLKLEEVSHIFGIPGGALAQLMIELHDTDWGMQYVICRHEAGAAYMADGYYRASGKLGVVMVTTGPGATNALTGAVNAEAACSRMLVLTGEVQEALSGRGYLQDGTEGPLNVNNVYENAVSYSAVLSSPQGSQTMFEAALRTAGAIPFKTAHLSLPVDVTMAEATYKVPARREAYTPYPAAANRHMVMEALDILSAAERPLILLGNGCRKALREPELLSALTRFVHDWGIPFMTTADGKGVFPETDPMSLRAFGIANCVWPHSWFTQTDPSYDCLLIVGSSLGDLATDKWHPLLRPKGQIIQVDADPAMIGRGFPVDLGLGGNTAAFIRSVDELAPSRQPKAEVVVARKDALRAIKSTSPFEDPDGFDQTEGLLHPAALCRVMQEQLSERKTMLMVDSGNCVGWAIHYLQAHPGFEVHASLDMGPMGYAVGAVVGAKMAHDHAKQDWVCVAITGDGAYMMQGTEVATAATHNVGAIWVVLEDGDLGMVSQGMSHYFDDQEKGIKRDWTKLYHLGQPDLVRFSEGLGADAYEADDAESFAIAMDQAIAGADAGKPQVIVARIDPDAAPPYYTERYARKQQLFKDKKGCDG